ncbi:unnamed protein product [Menidia menidia]|uniref:(Atlantic silverside) hypothetical protein n=1 Tax=Menidia menidia TaxID=238744 RepID=A0A8S4AKR5_9TELE|nr:unnamed protein product [Menidia menidia]
MEPSCPAFVALVAVLFCSGKASDICHQKPCPEYQVVETNPEFEERRYVATDWITTNIAGKESADFLAANERLKAECQRLKKAGQEIPDSWPVLVTVTEGTDKPDISLSWFVPPGMKPEISDSSVTLQHREAATVYIRSFGGTPSLQLGLENTKVLREALVKAGKSFDPHTYHGAAYDSFFSLTHHNEVWIYAA